LCRKHGVSNASIDLPLYFHPALIRASTASVTPFGARRSQ
jgi:hypothetical protein